jgi:hypothetical protein
VDGLTTPGFVQVAAHGLTELREGQLPYLAQVRNLLTDSRFDPHATSLSLPMMTSKGLD